VFLINGSTLEGFPEGDAPMNRLFRNVGDGKFEDSTGSSGLGRSGWGSAVCAGDYDNDGRLDLFVAYWGADSLYRNRDDGSFADSAAMAGVAEGSKQWSSGCTFVDYDRDGLLDLLVTQYQQFDPETAPPRARRRTANGKACPSTAIRGGSRLAA